MDNRAIAVIVPVYNRASVVLHTLDSVLRQSLPPRILIVVDDGSTDATADAVTDWLKAVRPSFVSRLVRQANSGVSAARNKGLAHITDAACVSFLDSDDLWPADFLQRTHTALMSSPHAVAITCDRVYADDGHSFRRVDDVSAIADDATRWLFVNDGGVASCSLFRTEPIQRLGGFDEHLPTGEDSELFLRLSLLGPWLHAPGAPVTFQIELAEQHGEQRRLSQTHDNSQLLWAQIHEDFITKNGGSEALPEAVYRDRLARRWYWAGRQLMINGRPDGARECFRRSLQWNLWKRKTWLRLLRTYLPTAA